MKRIDGLYLKVRVPAELYNRLRAAAERDTLSVSDYVRTLLATLPPVITSTDLFGEDS